MIPKRLFKIQATSELKVIVIRACFDQLRKCSTIVTGVTNSDRRLLCVTTRINPPNDPSKNRPAADCLTAALGHTGVETCISVNAARVASPPTTCTWTTNDDLHLCW